MSIQPKILVIDDDPRMGVLISRMSAKLGIECAAATYVDEFFKIYNDSIEIVVIDLSMPGVDGIALLSQLSNLQCQAGVIVISGLDGQILQSSAEVVQSQKLWLLGTLEKPFLERDFGALVLRHAQGRPLQHAHRATSVSVTPDELSEALLSNQLVVYYQPKIHAGSGLVVGMEALVRWQHPTHGLIYPDAFIPLAEHNNLIDDLGWYVARQSLIDIVIVHRETNESPKISINVSVQSLYDVEFPERLEALVASQSVKPETVVIEVTESQVCRDINKLRAILTRVRIKGFGVSIDDFGTGYASMSQLQVVPATELKIDKSFVQNALLTMTASVTVKKSIEIGKELKMLTVAEGVESAEQISFLKDAGCDVLQGFFFNKALPINEVVAWMNERRR